MGIKIQLNAVDRLFILQSLLPANSDQQTISIADRTEVKLLMKKTELPNCQSKSLEDGKVRWDDIKARKYIKVIEFEEAEIDLLLKQIKELSDAKKLPRGISETLKKIQKTEV